MLWWKRSSWIRGRGEVSRDVVAAGGCGATTGGHVEKYFGSSGRSAATGIRHAWRRRGRGGGVGLGQWWVREEREMGFWYAGTDTGDDQVGGWYCGGGGGCRRKMTAGEAGHRTAGGESMEDPMSKLRNNKIRILGTEWSMYEVGTPPHHNLDKPHGLVASI